MSVAKGLDELWLGVNCQSNLVIAGSPRNMFKHSTSQKPRGRATGWRFGPQGTSSNQTPNTRCLVQGSQVMEDKFHNLEGNNPDRRLRSLNSS